MSEPPDTNSNRYGGGGDWKALALMALASDELARAKLARVEHELEEALSELQWFRNKYGAGSKQL